MDTVNNITQAASRAMWGDSEGEKTNLNGEKSRQEPVSGQMGNVAAGEPYDKGNIEIPSSENVSPTSKSGNVTSTDFTTSTGDSSSTTNATAIQHDKTAKTGQSSLYNPILPATPGETTSSKFGVEASSKYGSESGAGSSVGADLRPAAQKAQIQKGGVTEDKIGNASVASTNGSKVKGYDEKFTNSGLTAKVQDTGGQKTTTSNSSGVKSTPTTSRPAAARDPDRADQAATRLVSVERTKSVEDSARAKVGARASSGSRLAASEADYGAGAGSASTAASNGKAADSPLVRKRKTSLKDKIMAKLRRTSLVA